MRFSRNISKYNLRQLTCVFHFRCNVVTSLPVEGYPGIVISWKYYTERLFDSSCVNHDSTQPQFSIYMCHAMHPQQWSARCAIIWREYQSLSVRGGGGGGGEKYSISNISHSPPFSSSTLGEISSIIFSQRVHASIVKFISWSIEIKTFTIGLI